MRLCGRSPKDAEPLNRDLVRSLYQKNLDQLIEGDNAQNIKYPLNANTKLMAIARTQWLRVTSAQEAMSQLLSSERVFADLHDWIRYGEPEQIVFRVWQNKLSLDYEFRCFVHDDRITVITQYDHYAVYPYLKLQKAHIQQLIEDKWREVHRYILQSEYAVDFGYLPESGEIILIEVSAFRRCTGPGCFHWDFDHDVMFGVDPHRPIEFRLNETLHPQIDDLVEANWECRWWTGAEPDPEPYWSLFDRVDPEWRSKIMQKAKCAKCRNKFSDRRWICLISTVFIAIDAVLWTIEWAWAVVVAVVIVIWIVLVYINRTYDIDSIEMDEIAVFKPLECSNEDHCGDIEHLPESVNDSRFRLFVYGTLKRGFQWNQKYLDRGAEFVCTAWTQTKWPLVMGECNVPYVLDVEDEGLGHCVKGELWIADYETMIGLDEFEGVHKGHYKRKLIEVVRLDDDGRARSGRETTTAYLYMKADISNIDLQTAEYLEEYGLDHHLRNYSPIKHIQVKQLRYLSEYFERT